MKTKDGAKRSKVENGEETLIRAKTGTRKQELDILNVLGFIYFRDLFYSLSEE